MVGLNTIDDDSNEYDLDQDLKAVSSFLRMDGAKIQLVINAFNKRGAKISYNKIRKLTGLDISDVVGMRDALATIVHFYVKHNKSFKNAISKSKFDSEIIGELNKWISKLDKKGLDGLDMLYWNLTLRPALIHLKLKANGIILTESDWLNDVLIAGIAKSRNAMVVTSDSDFERMDGVHVKKIAV